MKITNSFSIVNVSKEQEILKNSSKTLVSREYVKNAIII